MTLQCGGVAVVTGDPRLVDCNTTVPAYSEGETSDLLGRGREGREGEGEGE